MSVLEDLGTEEKKKKTTKKSSIVQLITLRNSNFFFSSNRDICNAVELAVLHRLADKERYVIR